MATISVRVEPGKEAYRDPRFTWDMSDPKSRERIIRHIIREEGAKVAAERIGAEEGVDVAEDDARVMMEVEEWLRLT